MDTDDALHKIFGTLSGGRLEDVADKLIALFRAPEWWEAEFDAQCVAGGSIGALQDTAQQVAIKACIHGLLTRAHHEAREQVISDIARLRDAFVAESASPAEHAAATTFAAFLLHALRQQDGTPCANPGKR
jgi:hypothetical protein